MRPFAQTVERPGGIDETTLHGKYLFVTWFVLLYEIGQINARKQPRKEPLKMKQRTKSSVVEAGDFVGCPTGKDVCILDKVQAGCYNMFDNSKGCCENG